MYWAKEGDFETHENVLSVIYNGAIASGLVYAQDEPTGVLAESYLIKLIGKEVSLATNLYLSCVLTHVIYPKYSRELLATWANKVENEFIALPTTKSGEIDFDYMENYIQLIVNSALKDFDAFINENALSSVVLTSKEKQVIEDFDSGKIRFVEFRIGDLFKVYSPSKRFNANAVTFGGQYPYVARGSENNGIRGFITQDIKYLSNGNTISFGQDTATIYYQKSPYFTGDKIKVMDLADSDLNENRATYLICAMRKAFSSFTWGNSSFNEDILNGVLIKLPVTQDNKIDYDFMENYIMAQKKLAMKDVVQYADRKIAATKQVIDPH